jgi:thymidine phosphorylase
VTTEAELFVDSYELMDERCSYKVVIDTVGNSNQIASSVGNSALGTDSKREVKRLLVKVKVDLLVDSGEQANELCAHRVVVDTMGNPNLIVLSAGNSALGRKIGREVRFRSVVKLSPPQSTRALRKTLISLSAPF